MNIIDAVARAWEWNGLRPKEVLAENDFGNMLILDFEGRYWRICPEELSCQVIAKSASEFASLIGAEDFQRDWAMAALVNEAKQRLGPLDAGMKFHFVIPGVLGGTYDISNIKAVPFIELIGYAGDLARQLKDLPDGTPIELRIKH